MYIPKSINLASKIHQVGLQNQEKSVLGGVWRGLGAILAPKSPPRPKYTSKPKVFFPSWALILEAKTFPKSIF